MSDATVGSFEGTIEVEGHVVTARSLEPEQAAEDLLTILASMGVK